MTSSRPFHFKQFSLSQSRAAMKVGFDGILLGAWVEAAGRRRILDVGTGTGLIALMLAQRTTPEAAIHAIDIDQDAIADATANFRASPWSERLTLECAAFDEFAATCESTFDLIVCNPPFFLGPVSPQRARHQARHAQSLPLESLLSGCRQIISPPGKLALIVPSQLETETRRQAANRGWLPCRELRARPLVDKAVHRVLIEFTTEPQNALSTIRPDELAIETSRHQYTEAFRTLTRDFYLAF